MRRRTLVGINNSVISFASQFKCERQYIGRAALEKLDAKIGGMILALYSCGMIDDDEYSRMLYDSDALYNVLYDEYFETR